MHINLHSHIEKKRLFVYETNKGNAFIISPWIICLYNKFLACYIIKFAKKKNEGIEMSLPHWIRVCYNKWEYYKHPYLIILEFVKQVKVLHSLAIFSVFIRVLHYSLTILPFIIKGYRGKKESLHVHSCSGLIEIQKIARNEGWATSSSAKSDLDSQHYSKKNFLFMFAVSL